MFYSQAVPSDTNGDRSLIKFYLIFMLPSNSSYFYENIGELESDG